MKIYHRALCQFLRVYVCVCLRLKLHAEQLEVGASQMRQHKDTLSCSLSLSLAYLHDSCKRFECLMQIRIMSSSSCQTNVKQKGDTRTQSTKNYPEKLRDQNIFNNFAMKLLRFHFVSSVKRDSEERLLHHLMCKFDQLFPPFSQSSLHNFI